MFDQYQHYQYHLCNSQIDDVSSLFLFHHADTLDQCTLNGLTFRNFQEQASQRYKSKEIEKLLS